MENRRTAKTWIVFAVLFVILVTHGGAARPVRSGCSGTPMERSELQAHAPDKAAAAAGPMRAGGNGIGDQKNFLPLGGVGMGAGMGGYTGMGGYLGGVGGGFGMGGGFGAGGGADMGGMGGLGTGPLGGLGGLGVGPSGTGVPLPLP